VNGIEAIHDAIMTMEGWHLGSRSQINRNPGNLRGSRTIPHQMDQGGYAVFPSIVAGSHALLDLITDYGNGLIKTGISWDSTLDDIFKVYAPQADHNQPSTYALFVAGFVSHCQGKPYTHLSTLREVCADFLTGGK